MSVQNGQYSRTNLAQTPGSVYPRFYLDTVEDVAASQNAGRPIFRDEERVEIFIPGNALSKVIERVNESHKERWPKEYEAFRTGVELSPDGTPLEEWPILKRSQIMELKALGFRTVEHVRDMNENAVQRIGMGGRRLKEAAAGFLEDADRVANENRLATENEQKDQRIAALERQVQELGALMQSQFDQLQQTKNAQPALATMIPGMADPVEAARQAQQQPMAASSLDNVAPRRLGRPRLPRDGGGNIIREAS